MDEILTQKELCELLKITAMTAYRYRRKGMPHIGAGKGIRYKKEDVLKWLEKRSKNE
jgi:excisionase family DNA binding protein